MSRRRMQMSNRKAAAQRRLQHFQDKANARAAEKQKEGLFSYRSSADTTKFKELSANTEYRRETQEYPSNNAIGGSTSVVQRSYVDTANVTIGQAYNKGNLVVLTKDEATDPRTGKRR